MKKIMNDLVIPDKCDNGISDHSLTCITAVWEEMGCLLDGTLAPSVLPCHVIGEHFLFSEYEWNLKTDCFIVQYGKNSFVLFNTT